MAEATDWFIALPSDAAKLVKDNAVPVGDQLTLWGVLLLELTDLNTLLVGAPFEPKLLHRTRDGSAVFAIPAELVQALAELAESDLESMAQRWCSVSEHLSDWPPHELSECLRSMSAFSTRALAE